MAHVKLLERLAASRAAGGLALRFTVFLAVLAAGVEYGRQVVATVYLLPISRLAAWCLAALSLPAFLEAKGLADGFCELSVGTVIYRVTFDCTGLFVLLALVALTLAYPTSLGARARGLLIAVPAVFAFATLRLVILGLVAYWQPAWVEVFHVFVMELVTIGFALFVWKSWIDGVTRAY